jgi:lipooligosaccharide transport system ATP-binding protein
MENKVIIVKDISKSFGKVQAVRNFSFQIGPATCFGLLGPNGAGKTTLMKMLYGKCVRDKDCAGTMDIFGYDPRRDELEIKFISGVVPQENNLDDELDVTENLMIFSKFYNIPTETAKERIAELLDFLELTEKAESKIKELSGGMKRRLVIVRALINNPKLLILDEPTTGLDPQVRHLIWDKLRQLKKQGTTILLTTHYMEEAFQLCDSIVIMHKGSEVMQGEPQELLEQNIEKYVLELLPGESVQTLEQSGLLASVRRDNTSKTNRLFSDNAEDLRTIANMLESGQYHVRQANLEDVFLKATGGTLDANQ